MPHLVDLMGDERSEEGADADAGDEVAGGTDSRGWGGVVAVLGVVQGGLHEIREGDRALFTDAGCEEELERALQGRGHGSGDGISAERFAFGLAVFLAARRREMA